MADKKLLWHSNAPWAPTGYGQQTQLFIRRLNQDYPLAVSAFYGLEGARLRYLDDIPIYPCLGGSLGDQEILRHAKHWFESDDLRSGMTVTLMDVWPLTVEVWRELDLVSWVPVDHEPVQPSVVSFLEDTGAVPLAMSRFGERMLKDAGLDPIYVPHGIDTELLKPFDRKEARRLIGVEEDRFVVGVVAANKGNPSRKSFNEIVQAFAVFRQEHDDAALYLHTDAQGVNDGVDLAALLRAAKIPKDSIFFGDQYRQLFDPIGTKLMAYLMSSFDVLLNPSRGEGFGIPVLEAQACGVPVIVTDFSAMPELCFAGWKVDCRREFTPARSWQVVPEVGDIVEALRHAYSLGPDTRREIMEQAVRGAAGYDARKVYDERMLPAFQEAERRLAERKQTDVVTRTKRANARRRKAAAA